FQSGQCVSGSERVKQTFESIDVLKSFNLRKYKHSFRYFVHPKFHAIEQKKTEPLHKISSFIRPRRSSRRLTLLPVWLLQQHWSPVALRVSQFLLDIARQKNQTPLPLIKPYSGPRLPPDRYCLTAQNYRLKSIQKKISGRITVPRLTVGALSSRPSTPTLGAPSAQTLSVSKVGTPLSLTGQRFTVQIPTSQTTVKTVTPTTPTVQNVLISPSLIGSKNILITTNMVSSQNAANESNSLKRKHDDDDDYDTL
ncbi:transcription initiation factor TFIID subunit 9-like, partial [Ascaphus truei]|uniref:transcription initiation factor TFIID subunit 9-like n=1 Tax=Ascaphus truei TaxID=8439 RepID=UPI003F59B50F